MICLEIKQKICLNNFFESNLFSELVENAKADDRIFSEYQFKFQFVLLLLWRLESYLFY